MSQLRINDSHCNCGGLTRRSFVQAGFVGLNLAGLLKAQAAQEIGRGRQRRSAINSCILIFYYGGPSHIDTFDMKPNAPVEIRGEFKSIATAAPSVHIGEHLPMTAKVMNKAALIRSMRLEKRLVSHDPASHHVLTGRVHPLGDVDSIGETIESFPSHGAVLSYMWRGERLDVVHSALPFVMRNLLQNAGQTPGFLGSAYDRLQIQTDLDTLTYRVDGLRLSEGLTFGKLEERRRLLRAIERLAVRPLHSKQTQSVQLSYEKAYTLLASQQIGRALNIGEEDEKTRRRYGYGPTGQSYLDGPGGDNGAQLGIARNMRGLNLLLARRLVEAGVPFVNVYDFKQQGKNWDSHSDNFGQLKKHLLPAADRSLSALIEDLDERGLLDTTLVVALGEFGRTPKINKDAGRDHWPDCFSVLLAGGGIRGGLVYGSSDKHGAYPETDAVTPGDLAATIFSRFGLDPADEIYDPTGRPHRLAEGRPIDELFG